MFILNKGWSSGFKHHKCWSYKSGSQCKKTRHSNTSNLRLVRDFNEIVEAKGWLGRDRGFKGETESGETDSGRLSRALTEFHGR